MIFGQNSFSATFFCRFIVSRGIWSVIVWGHCHDMVLEQDHLTEHELRWRSFFCKAVSGGYTDQGRRSKLCL